ncbi:MAG: FAD-dependent oxidoreductase [Bacteroidales bacterium]|nr:FAD-dependent oxidoreductase [Bacteroidales bacterium]
MDRRSFLHTGALTLPVIVSGLGWSGEPVIPPFSMSDENFREPGRNLPLYVDADVIVCGGGPAGIAAAITAARAGARTRLIELKGSLGGIWTSGLLTYIFDFDKPGLTRELVHRLDKRDARRNDHPGRFVYEPEEMKLLAEEMCVDAGVKIRLHTRIVAAYKEKNRLTTIVTESKSGGEAWRAKVFIDATGDGDLGALAGCGWDTGIGNDCPCQPLTMNALAMVRDASKMGEFISFYNNNNDWHVQATKNFLAEIHRAGMNPSYAMPTLFQVRDNLLLVMINHEYNIKAFDADAMTLATLRARAEISGIVKALNAIGGVWEGMRMVASAEQIGIRDGRRIHGRYKMTREDLIEGARHSDGVARASFNVDIHAADLETNRKESISTGGITVKPYDIPLRALIAKDVDGMMMAGRCISGDFTAHASYRVTGNAVAMGEAAGSVAYIAVKDKCLPHEVEWSRAADLLKQMGQRE